MRKCEWDIDVEICPRPAVMSVTYPDKRTAWFCAEHYDALAALHRKQSEYGSGRSRKIMRMNGW